MSFDLLLKCTSHEHLKARNSLYRHSLLPIFHVLAVFVFGNYIDTCLVLHLTISSNKLQYNHSLHVNFNVFNTQLSSCGVKASDFHIVREIYNLSPGLR